jgi:hypothetical protein
MQFVLPPPFTAGVKYFVWKDKGKSTETLAELYKEVTGVNAPSVRLSKKPMPFDHFNGLGGSIASTSAFIVVASGCVSFSGL